MSTENATELSPDWGGLDDNEISTLSESELNTRIAEIEAAREKQAANTSEPGNDSDEVQSGTGEEKEDTGIVEVGGTTDDFQPLDPTTVVPDVTHVEQSETDGDGDGTNEDPTLSTKDDQSSAAAGESDGEPESTDKNDYKAMYEGLLAPFKASGRMVQIESPEDAVRLMQMGYDYTSKMRQMKPHTRILKSLEHHDLLSDEKINFMIDLQKGNPEAIKKFLKDNSIDPIELDLEDGADYSPNDRLVSDDQIALDEVLESIKDTDSFARTANIITKEWDKDSQDALMGTPSVIAIINSHIGQGYFDQIATKVQYERSMGRLTGLSDLDAYKTVGDAIHAAGGFTPSNGSGTTTTEQGAQGHSQDPTDPDERKARKAAASPTKGKASARKAPVKNLLSEYTDAEMDAMSAPPL